MTATPDLRRHRRAELDRWSRSGRTSVSEGPQLVRIVIGVAVSWQLCVWLGAVHPPIYAALVPLVAMRDAPESAFNVSFARLVGVVGGLVLGMVVLSWLKPSAASVAVVMALALAAGIMLRVGGVLNLQVAISALMVFANADPSSYALDRLWETRSWPTSYVRPTQRPISPSSYGHTSQTSPSSAPGSTRRTGGPRPLH